MSGNYQASSQYRKGSDLKPRFKKVMLDVLGQSPHISVLPPHPTGSFSDLYKEHLDRMELLRKENPEAYEKMMGYKRMLQEECRRREEVRRGGRYVITEEGRQLARILMERLSSPK